MIYSLLNISYFLYQWVTEMKKLSHEYQLLHPNSVYTQKIEMWQQDVEVPIIFEKWSPLHSQNPYHAAS